MTPSNDEGEGSDASQRTDWDPTDANGAVRKREDAASAESRSNFLGMPNERFKAIERAFHARFDAALAEGRREANARARDERSDSEKKK